MQLVVYAVVNATERKQHQRQTETCPSVEMTRSNVLCSADPRDEIDNDLLG